MAQPLVVSISHQLGKAEAIRRLRDGIDYLKTHKGDWFSITRDDWAGDRLDFAISALKQSASGTVHVEDDRVTLSVTLPLLLAMVAAKVRPMIEREGTLLLEKK